MTRVSQLCDLIGTWGFLYDIKFIKGINDDDDDDNNNDNDNNDDKDIKGIEDDDYNINETIAQLYR